MQVIKKPEMSNGRIFVVGLLVFCWIGGMANAEYKPYQDSKLPLEQRVKDLLGRMTLEEKVGQMAHLERRSITPEAVKQYTLGSFLLTSIINGPGENAPPEKWVDLVNEFMKGSLASRLGIPILPTIDALHGQNFAYNATIFPHNIGLGATRDPVLAKKVGIATALELRATGIPFTFAPSIAVCRDPRWGRCYESYSEDAKLVDDMTEIIPGLQGDIPPGSPKGFPYLQGLQSAGACAKHYVGDGGTTKGINMNDTVISTPELLRTHMLPYYSSVIKGVSTIMISYSAINGLRMHAHTKLITGFLKKTLNFKGIVISDYKGIDYLTDPPRANYTYSLVTGLNAGIDMIEVPNNYTEFIADVVALVKGNFIPLSRIDDAVTRILRVKFIMGLFENPLADYSMTHYLGSKEHRELAREAVRKSAVLLKNGKPGDGPLLPLPKKSSKQILVTGTHADNLGFQCGGWTIEPLGLSGNITVGTTILQAIQNTVDKNTKVVYEESPDADFIKNSHFEYAVVVVGEPPYAEGPGDSFNLTLPESGYNSIKTVCGIVKCVVVLITGRPVVIEPYVAAIDALVAVWLPGTEGQGVADVLYGNYGFTGKLPRTWFKTVDQLPMNVGDQKYDPLFPFGFGLTTQPI